MLKYRRIWRVGACALTALGLVAAVMAWPPVAVLTFLLLATVVSAGTASVMTVEGQGLPWARVVGTGTTTAAVCVGAGGLIDLLGTWGFALVVAMAAVSPRLVAAAAGLGTRLLDEEAASAPPRCAGVEASPPDRRDLPDALPSVLGPPLSVDARWMVGPPEAMDDETLCLAWRSSFVALQAVSSMSRELQIIHRRQEILDEIERRNPRGFSAWLASKPRAAGDPSRFLTEGPGTRQRPPR